MYIDRPSKISQEGSIQIFRDTILLFWREKHSCSIGLPKQDKLSRGKIRNKQHNYYCFKGTDQNPLGPDNDAFIFQIIKNLE